MREFKESVAADGSQPQRAISPQAEARMIVRNSDRPSRRETTPPSDSASGSSSAAPTATDAPVTVTALAWVVAAIVGGRATLPRRRGRPRARAGYRRAGAAVESASDGLIAPSRLCESRID